jgi:hypothetical protein
VRRPVMAIDAVSVESLFGRIACSAPLARYIVTFPDIL